jgi:hypothetical protein
MATLSALIYSIDNSIGIGDDDYSPLPHLSPVMVHHRIRKMYRVIAKLSLYQPSIIHR